jgi:hypothetical protein
VDTETGNRVDPLDFLDFYQEQFRNRVHRFLEEIGLDQIVEISTNDIRRETDLYLTDQKELSRSIIRERDRSRGAFISFWTPVRW